MLKLVYVEVIIFAENSTTTIFKSILIREKYYPLPIKSRRVRSGKKFRDNTFSHSWPEMRSPIPWQLASCFLAKVHCLLAILGEKNVLLQLPVWQMLWEVIFELFLWIMGISESSGRRLKILSTVLKNRYFFVCESYSNLKEEVRNKGVRGERIATKNRSTLAMNCSFFKVRGITLELWQDLHFFKIFYVFLYFRS